MKSEIFYTINAICKKQENVVVFDFDATFYNIKNGHEALYHEIWIDSGLRMMKDYFPNKEEKEQKKMLNDFWFSKGHIIKGIQELSEKELSFPKGFPPEYYLKEEEIKKLVSYLEPNRELLKWATKIKAQKMIISDFWDKNIFSIANHLEMDLSIFKNKIYGTNQHWLSKKDVTSWYEFEKRYFSKAETVLFLDDNLKVVEAAKKACPKIIAPWHIGKGAIESFLNLSDYKIHVS
ncbi:MAG: HAD hydrolase-like protein [Alphaproteobacteria bacterium]|nr:HAD hydrolase-like protein [Alphaproteobacteria bacterium]MBN2780117.1 HAD hydrolase-like protein [Alphaproteobacteria bacterium]